MNLERVIKFANKANKAHKGQVRKFNGEPYILHPIRVAKIVESFTSNQDMIAAAYLHDVHEDTKYYLEGNFFCCEANTGYHYYSDKIFEVNPVVAALVVELTNVFTKEAFPDDNRKHRKTRELERISKISWFARFIKLCDRLDNVTDFARDDPRFGPDYYYVKETKDLIRVLADDSPEHKILVSRINAIIGD